MNLYALCLIVIVVLQVLLAIFVFVYNQDVQNAANRGWDRIWSGRTFNNRDSINQRVIDEIQTNIECCGSLSPLDYGPQAIPASCCQRDAEYCNTITAYKTGCRTQIQYYIQNSSQWIAYLSIAMAIVEVSESFFNFISVNIKYLLTFQLVGVIFGCCLSSNIRNNSR